VVLTADDDASVAQAAREAVVGHPENIIAAATEAISDPAVLDFLGHCALPVLAKEKLVLNKSAADETLLHIATHEQNERVLDILAGNQARMLNHVAIAEQLIDNPKLAYSTRKRLEEFFMTDFAEKILADAPASSGASSGPVDDFSKDFAAALATVPLEEGQTTLTAEQIAKQLLEESAEGETTQSPAQEEDSGSGGIYKQILGMRVSQKIKLALKGNKEARSILIKDSNKMVCTGVLRNSRITDGEVVAIASSKSSIEDLLRIIAGNPGWMRLYQVKHALANNAKTPIPISMKVLPLLHEHDLAALSKGRGVSAAVKQAAGRLLKQRQKK
jgi:hypothetical protein